MVQEFDAMILRIPHGWLKLDEITQETFVETIEMAHKVFGIKTVIVMTLYLNNNVKTMEDLEQMHQVNDMIRNVIGNWKKFIAPNTIEHVLMLDFGQWTDQITQLNAKLAGGLDMSIANYTLERWSCTRYPPSIAMICTDPVKPGQCQCNRNMISIDGLHWCMESVGGRTIAAIGCLLQCAIQPNASDDKIKVCERACNDKFMSLLKVSRIISRRPSTTRRSDKSTIG